MSDASVETKYTVVNLFKQIRTVHFIKGKFGIPKCTPVSLTIQRCTLLAVVAHLSLSLSFSPSRQKAFEIRRRLISSCSLHPRPGTLPLSRSRDSFTIACSVVNLCFSLLQGTLRARKFLSPSLCLVKIRIEK